MKSIKKFLAFSSALFLLTGCEEYIDTSSEIFSSSSSSSESTSELSSSETETSASSAASSESTTESTSEAPAPAADSLTVPVIEINTKNTSPDALDFVTKPVTRHVAEAIASWTPGYKIPPEPYYEECTVNVFDKDNNCLIDSADAKVKVRGNWTTNYEKKPLRIKFDKKQNMLGLNGGAEFKNWLLLAEYKDASMLRDKSALAVAREILGADGLYASDADFAEVYINGEYWGMYLLAEMQQTAPGRIDINEPEKDYTGTDIGYFLEFDGYYTNEDELHGFSVDYHNNAPLIPFDGDNNSSRTMTCLPENSRDPKKDVGFTIKSDIYSQQQHDFIASYVANVYNIMYEAAYFNKAFVFDDTYTAISETKDITPQQAVEKVVNVDSLADMYIISELTCDADIYWSSFFMDADFSAGGDVRLTFEAPWDFDSSMGNKDRCADGTGFYAANIVPDVNGGPNGRGEYETINPWLAVLMHEDWFNDIIREKWSSAYDSGTFTRACDMITSDADKLSDAFDRNYNRWDNIRNNDDFANELSSAAAKCKNHKDAAAYLAEWLSNRVAFLNNYWHI